ncbi:VOC family protein [Nocardia sp. CA-135953]|uniref:VOC family protein n=1 Tax=Nocardia sp. CA-135953 TaxID=3239978 RepID=UPI003D968B6A
MVAVKVLGIDNVLVPVGDLGLARDFYETKLGLSVKFVLADHGIALFKVGDEAPGILVRTDPLAGQGTKPAMRLWLEVPDAQAAAEEMASHGVEPLAPPFEVNTGWTIEIADPWGNVIGLTDYRKNPGLARLAE